MNDFYHICMTAHSEVLIRNPKDASDITNLIALSAYRTDTQILVDAIMSNHIHLIVLSEKPEKIVLSLRISITKHFNAVHLREGRLFDRKVFISKLEGSRHIIMAINYVLKNPVHHGQTGTPYSYPHSTANYLFQKDRGIIQHNLESGIQSKLYHPKNAQLPYKYTSDYHKDVINRSSFEEIKLVESMYLTSNYFIYNMNRRTSEEWIKEQEQDHVQQCPVTLELIEKGVKLSSINEMLKNENANRTARLLRTDMEVCELIDSGIIDRYKAMSIYRISTKQRLQIAMNLIKEPDITLQVASRAVVIPLQLLQNEYTSLYGDLRHRP